MWHGEFDDEYFAQPLPDPAQFDPSPEDERELRERLLKAGEQRAE